MNAVIVLPSLNINGGVREALNLGRDLGRGGLPTGVVSMWDSVHPMDSVLPVSKLSGLRPRAARAALDLPVLTYRFASWLRKGDAQPSVMIFTHYSTLPLALLVPRQSRYFYVQGAEWKFLRASLPSAVLRRIVLSIYRTGRIISANPRLSAQLAREGLDVAFEAPIWAMPDFAGRIDAPRDLDFAMVLRKSPVKRLDLYLRFIEMAHARRLRMAVITPESDIAEAVSGKVDELLLRPDSEQMRAVYERSRCFLHLSEYEGFGLPPLEAMGSGCVPVCRDSGGVRSFMLDAELKDRLLPLTMPLETIFDRAAQAVAQDSGWQRASIAARRCFDAGLRDVADARRDLAANLQRQAGARPLGARVGARQESSAD